MFIVPTRTKRAGNKAGPAMRDRHAAVLERLAQGLEDRPVELRDAGTRLPSLEQSFVTRRFGLRSGFRRALDAEGARPLDVPRLPGDESRLVEAQAVVAARRS